MPRIVARLVLLGALVGCSDDNAGPWTLSGVWNISPPSGWTVFRMTLTQSDKSVSGSVRLDATATPGDTTYTVTGTVAVDTFDLHFGLLSDGSHLDMYGRVIAAASLNAWLYYTDAVGVVHPVSVNAELDRSHDGDLLHFTK